MKSLCSLGRGLVAEGVGTKWGNVSDEQDRGLSELAQDGIHAHYRSGAHTYASKTDSRCLSLSLSITGKTNDHHSRNKLECDD